MPGLYADRGKAVGCRPRVTSNRSSGDGEDCFPARDIREGQGSHIAKPNGQRPTKFTCSTCGLARELVTKAFGLGKSSLSCRVSSVIVTYLV